MQIQTYNISAYVDFEAESIECFLETIENIIKYISTDPRACHNVKFAINELVTNALEHGYKKKRGKVSVYIKKLKNKIKLEISDEGIGMDPLRLDCDRSVDKIETQASRGWGIFLTKKLSSSMEILPNKPVGTKVIVEIPENNS